MHPVTVVSHFIILLARLNGFYSEFGSKANLVAGGGAAIQNFSSSRPPRTAGEMLQAGHFQSTIECSSIPDAPLPHKRCICKNCCIHENEVFVFDATSNNDDDHNSLPKSDTMVELVTMQMFERKRSIPVLHHSHDFARQHFSEGIWVETSTHLTSNFYFHILAQWFWNADVYSTWKHEGWIAKNPANSSFNWMLEFNLGQREDLVESWYRVTHPANQVS